MRRLACCGPVVKNISLDFQEQQKIVTYNGLESFILNSSNYDDESSTSRAEGCTSDSLDEYDSYSSSSKDASGSCSSKWVVNKEQHGLDEKEVSSIPQHLYVNEKQCISINFLDVDTMKEKFSKLLLGEDVTGGSKGVTTALALSNAITNLAASVFGELWKLEPLSEERKSRWRREMGWFLSPANYMVELVPAKQNGTNGLEIMTPKVRSDVCVNLPALQKLDSMLIETLDLMVKTEFWYVERGSRAEGRTKHERMSKRWWLPSPQVPMGGLSVPGRKKLLYHGKVVDQVFKVAKLINNRVLLEMPVPTAIRNALPNSGRENLGDELYRLLSTVNSPEEMLSHLDLKDEHTILQLMNQLEAGMLAWKQKISDQVGGKSPLRSSWPLMRDSVAELHKVESMLGKAQALLQVLRIKFPNLPQTFLDVTKVQYNKDVGHSILEAYSRVVGNLAFSILSRIKDILQEDDLSKPNSPAVACHCSGINLTGFSTTSISGHIRHSLIDQMNKADGQYCDPNADKAPGVESVGSKVLTCSLTATSSRRRVWCIGREFFRI
ncbi:Rop guanine nucleotide exchange factor [Thalictrum thalictroides]|uniref:Rop guanine nucleotide exchange factor n=1 Tax=Thalictrum thalictroides TaxID=46969 RepID=A0A7J6UXX1_THATH|nr:Rop guanine nucleotide exchange factor [Thalictrum thalictroides]